VVKEATHRYFVLHKPYNMVSQFVSSHKVPLLGLLNYEFPEGTYAVGRLDKNSEGVLLLTNNKRVIKLLFMSSEPHRRTYHVWVRGVVSQETLEKLKSGVDIVVQEGTIYRTPPIEAEICEKAPPDYEFPYKANLYVPYTWLKMDLYEGKFHQVRKMVAAIGHPCKRLIRTEIEDISLNGIAPGEILELEESSFFKLLKIKYP
jgi:23S rRNA pseudouridine2457 synthase